MNKKILILLPALALLLGGCQKGNTSSSGASQPTSSSSEEVAVEGVNISQTSATLDPGEKLQLSAVATPSTLSEKGVNWSTDAEGVATVSSGGLVTAVSQGTAHIKATAKADSTKSATCTITVNKDQILVLAESIDVEKTYKLGLYQTKLEKYLYFNGTIVDDDGKVSADGKRFGSSQSFSDAVDVKLEQQSAGVYKIAVTIGDAKKYFSTVSSSDYHAALKDAASAATDWTWDETYYTFTTTVSGTKYFVGTSFSYETISVSDYNKYVATNDVLRLMYKVDKVDPTSVSIVEDAANVYAGGTVQLHAKAAPEGAQDAKITWSVTGNDKVSVDQNGLVTATEDAVVGSTATVKATWGTLEGDTCVVTVLEKLNYGTLTNPLTIAEAKALIDKVPAGKLTAEKMFVKGYVSAPHKKLAEKTRNDVWLTNDDGSEEKAFELFSVYADASLGEIAENSLIGKQVTAEGWGTLFNGTYEFSNKNAAGDYDNGWIRKVENGTRVAEAVELSEESKFEVKQGEDKTVSAAIKPYGATAELEWAVAPADKGVEYKDGKIVASNTAEKGDYTLTVNVKGSTTIKDTVAFAVVEGSGAETAKVTIVPGDGTAVEATDFTITKTPISVTVKESTLTADQIRVFKGKKMTISGATITKIELTCTANGTAKYGPGAFGAGAPTGYTFEASGPNGTWTGNSTSVEFTATDNQVRVTQIVVTYVVAA